MAHLGKLETQLELPLPQPQPSHFSIAHMFLMQSESGKKIALSFGAVYCVPWFYVGSERTWGLAVREWGHADKGRRRKGEWCFSFPNLVSLLNPDLAMFMSPRLRDPCTEMSSWK